MHRVCSYVYRSKKVGVSRFKLLLSTTTRSLIHVTHICIRAQLRQPLYNLIAEPGSPIEWT